MELGKIIGFGNTADVYGWEESKVLKLFHQGYPYEAVRKEYQNAMALRDLDFPKPRGYEIISYDKQTGIVYDRVEGESLLDWVMRTGDVQQCAILMSKLHKSILQNKIQEVPYYKDFLRLHIANRALLLEEQEEALQMVDRLSEDNTLCHGDFHPGNIILTEGQAYVIDFMNICQGPCFYDIARTVYLIEYTPIPSEVKDRDLLIGFRRSLSDLYLLQMNVARELIKDYLDVIAIARKGECPNE